MLSWNPSHGLPAVTGLTEGRVEVPGVEVTEWVYCDEPTIDAAKTTKV